MTQKKWKPASRCSSEHRSSTRRSTAEPQHCWLLSPLQHNCCQPSDCQHIGCQLDNVNTIVIGALIVSLIASMTHGLSIKVHLVSLSNTILIYSRRILQLAICSPTSDNHLGQNIIENKYWSEWHFPQCLYTLSWNAFAFLPCKKMVNIQFLE